MVLTTIGEKFKDEISKESGVFLELDIGTQAEKLGYSNIANKYREVNAVVPLKQTVNGMKVIIECLVLDKSRFLYNHGRGIVMTKNLLDLQYLGAGNEVLVTITLSNTFN